MTCKRTVLQWVIFLLGGIVGLLHALSASNLMISVQITYTSPLRACLDVDNPSYTGKQVVWLHFSHKLLHHSCILCNLMISIWTTPFLSTLSIFRRNPGHIGMGVLHLHSYHYIGISKLFS